MVYLMGCIIFGDYEEYILMNGGIIVFFLIALFVPARSRRAPLFQELAVCLFRVGSWVSVW